MVETIEERRAEYDAHIWNHVDDAFQKSFDSRRPLSDSEIAFIDELIDVLASGEANDALAEVIRRHLHAEPDLTWVLLQLVGLTRSKILTDLKSVAAVMDDKPSIPSISNRLTSNDATWALAGPYLATAVRKTFRSLLDYEDRAGAIEAMNQATWPGYIRQERAKRQGHEAEGRIAQTLFALGIQFEPKEKADNPLSGDVQIAGVSFDLVAPAVDMPTLVVKSTVQTANIGQFGQSKVDLEIQEAQTALTSLFGKNKPIVVAFVDGVGFYSNTRGLHGALGGADEFAQFKTLWKIPVMAASKLDIPIEVALPSADIPRHESFLDRYSSGVSVTKLTAAVRGKGAAEAVEAGEAFISRR